MFCCARQGMAVIAGNSGNSGLSAEKTHIIGLKRTHNIGGGHL
jgi:hypothetical protein